MTRVIMVRLDVNIALGSVASQRESDIPTLKDC